MTPEEDDVLAAQLAMALDAELPVMVHTPHRDKLAGTRRTLDVVRESGLPPERVLVDHLNETTVAMVRDAGAWAGFSIYPDTKMDERRMVALLQEYGPDRMIVNSAADWGRSDPLKTARTGQAMLDAGFTDDDVDRVLWRNPVAFYAQSDNLVLDPVPGFVPGEVPAPAEYEGSGVLRGVRA
jgi:predicted metal-dependent TIM-barrel fold hydrolase